MTDAQLTMVQISAKKHKVFPGSLEKVVNALYGMTDCEEDPEKSWNQALFVAVTAVDLMRKESAA